MARPACCSSSTSISCFRRSGFVIEPFLAGVLGLTINYSAYLAEVYRAGIAGGAARTGRGVASARHVATQDASARLILPQAIRVVIPPLGNYFISLFKDTSLVSTVTVRELMFTGQIIASMNFQYFTIFTIIGIIYFGLSLPGALVVKYLERRMQVGPAACSSATAPRGAAT